MLRPAHNFIDYRDDELLLGALEAEIKLASRFFNVVDFITENIDEQGEADRELMAEIGQAHWQRAKKIIKARRDLIKNYGPIPNGNDDDDAGHSDETVENGRKSPRLNK